VHEAGHRRSARRAHAAAGRAALAALDGAARCGDAHLKRIAPSALRHRLRRNPLDDAGSSARVERAMAEMFGF
jgi:magnesium chelatase subunit I